MESSEELSRIASLPDGLEKTARLVAWLQELYGDGEDRPILVGGAAGELYTGSARSSGDIDFVGHVPAHVARGLTEAGFRPRGRHWVHEDQQIFVEFSGSTVQQDQEIALIELEGERVLAMSPEDLIVDRLASWKFWQSSVDGVNAYRLYFGQLSNIDISRLRFLASGANCGDALERLERFASRYASGSPSAEDLERWAVNGP
jgi:hypothetical protein